MIKKLVVGLDFASSGQNMWEKIVELIDAVNVLQSDKHRRDNLAQLGNPAKGYGGQVLCSLQEQAKPEGRTGFLQVCTCLGSSHPDLCPIHGKPMEGVTTFTLPPNGFVPASEGDILNIIIEWWEKEQKGKCFSDLAHALVGKVAAQSELHSETESIYNENLALREWKRKKIEEAKEVNNGSNFAWTFRASKFIEKLAKEDV